MSGSLCICDVMNKTVMYGRREYYVTGQPFSASCWSRLSEQNIAATGCSNSKKRWGGGGGGGGREKKKKKKVLVFINTDRHNYHTKPANRNISTLIFNMRGNV